MPYAVFHISKNKIRALDLSKYGAARLGNYLERLMLSKGADPARRHLNVRLHGSGDLAADMSARLAVVDHKIRHSEHYEKQNAVLGFEVVLTATRSWFSHATPEQLSRWVTANDEVLSELFGRENIVAGYLHLDQTTPNCHYVIVPVVDGHRLCAKELIGGQPYTSEPSEKFVRFHDVYAAKMADLGLERGVRGSHAKHQSLSAWRLQQAQQHKDYRVLGNATRSLPLSDVLRTMGATHSTRDDQRWYLPDQVDGPAAGKHIIELLNGGTEFVDCARPDAFVEAVTGRGAIDLVMYLRSCTFTEAIDYLDAEHLAPPRERNDLVVRFRQALAERPQPTPEERMTTISFGTPSERAIPRLVLVDSRTEASAYIALQHNTPVWGTVIALEAGLVPANHIRQALAETSPRWQVRAAFGRDDAGLWEDLEELFPTETNPRGTMRITRERPHEENWSADLARLRGPEKARQETQEIEQAMDIDDMMG